ncbi:MAG: CRISPR-associated protein Cas4 [Sulfolobales archaeon]
MISTKPLDTVTPSLVKQYSYCPVIVWLKAWFLLEEPATDSMMVGKECTKPPEGKGQVYVRTRSGATVIDEVVENKDGSKVITERKAYRSHNYSRYVEQLVASYLIAREKIQGIRAARIQVGDAVKTLELSEDLAEDVEKIVEKTREMVTRETAPPRPLNTRKCTSCWYKRYCPHW